MNLALDVNELNMYTSDLTDGEGFVEAYNHVFYPGLGKGQAPRPRFRG